MVHGYSSKTHICIHRGWGHWKNLLKTSKDRTYIPNSDCFWRQHLHRNSPFRCCRKASKWQWKHPGMSNKWCWMPKVITTTTNSWSQAKMLMCLSHCYSESLYFTHCSLNARSSGQSGGIVHIPMTFQTKIWLLLQTNLILWSTNRKVVR